MKTFTLLTIVASVIFVTHSHCFAEKDTVEQPKYLENIYFALSNSTSQHNIKKLAEFILSNHGVNAEINVSI